MLSGMIDFFRGYLQLQLEGIHLERLLNMAIGQNIHLWDIKRLSDTVMRLKVSRRGFGKLRHAVYKTRTRVHICGKHGWFLWKRRILSGKWLAISLATAGICMLFLSSLVLDIRVIGNSAVAEEEILAKLSEINLKKGVFRGNIDGERVSDYLVTRMNNIAWVGIQEKGTQVIVEIKERRPAPEIVPADIPCHIIATKEAVVQTLTVENGEAAVQPGEVVAAGQILISGIVESERAQTRYLHAMGRATGKTWHEETVVGKLYTFDKEYTGNSCKERSLSFGEREIGIPHKPKYYNYDTETRRRIFGFLTWETKEYKEYTLHRRELSEDDVKKQSEEALLERLYALYEKEKIHSVSFTHSYNQAGELESRLLAECIEEIGIEMDFEIQEESPDE